LNLPINQIICGDNIETLRTLPHACVDSCVTDPPYGLEFMGKQWDKGVPGVELWREVLRVLKPGGHLLAFAGTRTQHRMATAIEDAGFEIRDMIAWVYGSGFSKSMDVSKAIDKRGGSIPWQAEFAEHLRAIKPAALRAADINAHVANGSKSNFWGHFIDTQCQPLLPTLEQYRKLRELLPIDPAWDQHFLPEAEREVVGRKRTGDPVSWYAEAPRGDGLVNITAPATEAAKQWAGWGTSVRPALEPITWARKPLIGTVAANVLQHGTGAVNVDGCKIDGERLPANFIHDGSEEAVNLLGEADRYFYCAKADASERRQSKHPTIKPVALMRYLVRLVTPPGGLVLDPFGGSGTTAEAARLEHCRYLLMELNPEYCADAAERLRQGVLF
jgi:DNA modification methylase